MQNHAVLIQQQELRHSQLNDEQTKRRKSADLSLEQEGGDFEGVLQDAHAQRGGVRTDPQGTVLNLRVCV